MPENIIKEIEKAEKKGEAKVTEAKREAHFLVARTVEKVEKDLEKMAQEIEASLKGFREEKRRELEEGASKLKKKGLEENEAYKEELEKKMPDITTKIADLIKRELCL